MRKVVLLCVLGLGGVLGWGQEYATERVVYYGKKVHRIGTWGEKEYEEVQIILYPETKLYTYQWRGPETLADLLGWPVEFGLYEIKGDTLRMIDCTGYEEWMRSSDGEGWDIERYPPSFRLVEHPSQSIPSLDSISIQCYSCDVYLLPFSTGYRFQYVAHYANGRKDTVLAEEATTRIPKPSRVELLARERHACPWWRCGAVDLAPETNSLLLITAEVNAQRGNVASRVFEIRRKNLYGIHLQEWDDVREENGKRPMIRLRLTRGKPIQPARN